MSRWMYRSLIIIFLGVFALTCVTGAYAQKKKKDDTKTEPAQDPSASIPDSGKIDYLISEWLAAWQIGDIERLHKNIADDVVVVNGSWAPPLVGWNNYLTAYQSQRARTQQVRLERTNTLIRADGNVAWACYQWEFSGLVDGRDSGARGQTTLIFEKRADKWLIVHNHTSIVETPLSNIPATPATNGKP